jgi:hypothetical protein
MTLKISAVAACCSRASFRSLLGPDGERRLARVPAGARRRLVLVVLWPFAGLRCGLSPRSSCRPFLMAAPYTPPGSRRASYRARPSFWKRQISQGRLANWPVRRRLRVQSRKCSCLHGTSVVPSRADVARPRGEVHSIVHVLAFPIPLSSQKCLGQLQSLLARENLRPQPPADHPNRNIWMACCPGISPRRSRTWAGKESTSDSR